MTVLHLQKVAGISGSEAHLLALLPQLKQRGWDIRFLMLHEHERAHPRARGSLGTGELAHVDTVPDRPHLRRLEREGAAVDADDCGREERRRP